MNNYTEQPHSSRYLGKFVWTPVLIVTIIHLLAALSLFHFSIKNLIGFLIAHFLVGCIGAVIGLHRYFSHRTFKAPKLVEWILGILATLNLQNGPITWAMYHRAHHRFSDGRGDPHSASLGFLWSHVQWLFYVAPNGFRKNSVSVSDWNSSRFIYWLDKNYLLINAIAPILFLLLTQDIGLFLWVFPLRIVVLWHSIWAINSYTHSASLKPRQISDMDIKNSFVVSLLVYGEGWHNNHHKFPALPRAGIKWYQIDPAYYLLILLDFIRVIKIRKNHVILDS